MMTKKNAKEWYCSQWWEQKPNSDWKDGEWVQLAQDKGQWRAVVSKEMNL
jgi:hypothetical protein